MDLSPVLIQSLEDGICSSKEKHIIYSVWKKKISLGMIIFNHVKFHEIYNRSGQNFETEQVLYFVTEPPKAFSLLVICPKGNQVPASHFPSGIFPSSHQISRVWSQLVQGSKGTKWKK